MEERIICQKCGKNKPAKDYFMRKDHMREPLCKDCLTMFIDNKERTTFEWILEKFDVPYIETEWIKIYNETMKKKGKVGSDAVLGKYLRLMKINQFSKYTYADTEKLQFETNKNLQQVAARLAVNDANASAEFLELQKQLDNGEISQAQFDTLNPLSRIADEQPEYLEFAESSAIDEDEILAQLTDEEIKMLKLKWGSIYRPSQWIQMEETYTQYSNEYELNTDREKALRQICKLLLKMDEALDIGDTNGYKALSAAYDTLRKSAKFTDAQKDFNATRAVDSIGELVLLCEKEGDIIPRIPNPDDTPQDNVDFAIKDIKAYIYHLAVNELGMGDRIEKLIEEMQRQVEEENEELDDTFILSADDEAQMTLSDEEEIQAAKEFSEFFEHEMDEEIDRLIEGDENEWH